MRQSSTEPERNVDSRSLYTKNLIKSSLIELLKTHSFTSVSVTALAEKAGIGRNTFYRHFSNTFEVLVASIDDALSEVFNIFSYLGIGTKGRLDSYIAPFCEYVLNTTRYKLLFTDSDLHSIIIDRILAFDNRIFVRTLESSGFEQKQAEALVRLKIAGVLEICTTYINAKDEEKAAIVAALEKL